MANPDDVSDANEGTPPDSRNGSTEDHVDLPERMPLIDQVGAENYAMYMAQALKTDFWGYLPGELKEADLYVLIGALNQDRLALGRELDIAMRQLAAPGGAGAPRQVTDS